MVKKLLLGLFCIMLLTSIVSAIGTGYTFDDSKKKASITDWYGVDPVMDVQMIYNTDQCLIDCYAILKVNSYKTVDFKSKDDFNFLFKNKTGHDVKAKVKYKVLRLVNKEKLVPNYLEDTCNYESNGTTIYYRCERLEGFKTVIEEAWEEVDFNSLKIDKNDGDVYLKLVGQKSPSESVDFLPRIYAQTINELAWWNMGWDYRKNVTINSRNGNLTYINLTYDGHMNADFSDVRFTTIDDSQDLSYWIESKVDSGSAVMILQTNNASVVRMYYGNSLASASSNSSVLGTLMNTRYTFDELTGTTITDKVSGKLADTTMDMGITGIIGTAHHNQRENNDSVDFRYKALYDEVDFTISLWIKKNDTGINYVSTIYDSKLGGGSEGANIISYAYNAPYYCPVVGGSLGQRFCIMNYSMLENNWLHLVWVHKANINNNTFYVNGSVAVLSNVTTGPSYSAYFKSITADYNENNVNFRLGQSWDATGRQFNGTYDELMIFNSTLTSDQITNIYNMRSSAISLGTEETQAVVVEVNSTIPVNNTNSSSNNITFGCSAYSPIQFMKNLSLYIDGQLNYTLTNNIVNELSFERSVILSEGSHNWSCKGFNQLAYSDQSQTRNVTIDLTRPSVTATNVTNLTTGTMPVTAVWLNTISDLHLSKCFYNISGGSLSFFTCGNAITYQFTTAGLKTVSICANDSSGNLNCSTSNIYVSNYTRYAKVNSTEGNNELFNLNISIDDSVLINNAYLNYDGVNYSATSASLGSGNYSISRVLTIPSITTTSNKTHYWILTLSNNQILTTPSSRIEIFNIGVDSCASYTYTLFNFTLYDEETQQRLNGTVNETKFEIDVNIYSNGILLLEYNGSFPQINPINLCTNVNVTNSTYEIYAVAGYSATGYVQKFFYVDNGTLNSNEVIDFATNKTKNLYLLKTADSTTFLFNYENIAQAMSKGAIVHVFRKYIGDGLFKEVERAKQDDNEQTHVHLVEEDVIYYFVVSNNGTILYTSSQYNAKCLSTPCSITFDIGSSVFTPFPTGWEKSGTTSYVVFANSTTRQVVAQFNDPSAIINFTLAVYTDVDGEMVVINSDSITGSSGQVVVNVPNGFGNQTFYSGVFKNGQLLRYDLINFKKNSRDAFGLGGVFMASMIFLVIALMGVTEGKLAVVFGIFALIIIVIMALVDLSWLAVISLICAMGVIGYKIIQRKQ